MAVKRLYQTAGMIVFLSGAIVATVYAQSHTALTEGIRNNTPAVHALIHARIVPGPGKQIEDGTLVIRDGIIVAVGPPSTAIPKDARVWDMKGLTLYPGLMDSYTNYGMPPAEEPRPGRAAPPQTGRRGPIYWNGAVMAERNASDLFAPDPAAAEKLRSQGITAVFSVPTGGIFRGTGAVVSTGDGKATELVIRPRVAQVITLDIPRGRSGYPGSLMGAIALIRQTFLDAGWYQLAWSTYRKNTALERPEINEGLDALKDVLAGTMPVMIEASDELNVLRAEKIAEEFSLHLIVRGSGREYRRLDAVAATHRPMILPVNFPEPPAVQTPEEALQVSLAELRYWDEAPENPGRLVKAGVQCGLATVTLKDPATFLARVRTAVERGLPPDAALAALTSIPAKLYGTDARLGSLEPGKIADIVVADGDLFAEKTLVKEVWVDGKLHDVRPREEVDPRGTWSVRTADRPDTLTLVITGEPDALQGTMKHTRTAKLSFIQLSPSGLALVIPGDSIGIPGIVRMTATVGAEFLQGHGEWPDGTGFLWSATRTAPFRPAPDTTRRKPPAMASFPPVYPEGAFGRRQVPPQIPVILVRNATIWTCGPGGKLENSDILFRNGKVAQLGRNLKAPANAMVIHGSGKDVTPGLIDAHSHTAISGDVNEAGRAVSAMVRIGDVIDCDDIAIYRELAGGLTVANVLHGSANPIGGQCQTIKLRWGMLPDQMKFEGAPATIKFALGENVKQSNWGEHFTTRYPQTRMGVEELMRDEFRAALDYRKKWQAYGKDRSGIPPRRDLELDAILEVLDGKRLVHCHSYRQDEILMLMRLADDFGFHIRTFQHVLEGYKVADEMAKHGASGSTFSDWWAYKFEVYDAIPYNGPLMHDQGVVVSYNSDSDELARRLNLEAAKAVKYGSLSEEEALKFVTINPAKQVGVDNRVGSLEVGKDADFVVWSGDPLSTHSLCEQTWIEGRRFFDRGEDRQMYAESQKDRAVLIQKILSEKKPPSSASGRPGSRMHATEVTP